MLRVEDTDQDRSKPEFTHALQEDLWWLGLQWQEGPVQGGDNGPYHQFERQHIYADYYQRLEAEEHAYPCFCSEQELKLARKAQLNAGKPPRYSGKCARLSETERQSRLEEGIKSTLRFRVPDDRNIEFTDLVRGEQRYAGRDIGDFIIRRADGTPAFFFSNAVDDSLMGITLVMRGEDHISNTPRQILILEALGLTIPGYGHITMIVGADGSPLSKRHGSRSLRELRQEGYFPEAVTNYLARLGHNYERDDFLDNLALGQGFEVGRLGKSPARYDGHQLLHWQHQAIMAASNEALWEWMGEEVHHIVPTEHAMEFVETIRPNISFPEHALKWAKIIFHDPLTLDDDAREIVAEAGKEFFKAAVAALENHADDFKAFSAAVKEATGVKGKGLFMPLRVALSGESGGPEMARLLPLLTKARAQQRLAACTE